MADKLNLHAMQFHSRANGPGLRLVLWLQGCRLACPGCFNPQTHSCAPRQVYDVDKLAGIMLARRGQAQGVTISGGEPLEQAPALLRLLEVLRNASDLSVLLFSGYALAEIQAMPQGPAILSKLDVLIAGRYDQTQGQGTGLLGSRNQRIHLLSNRYTLQDLAAVPPAEIHIDPDGQVTLSGIAPLRGPTG